MVQLSLAQYYNIRYQKPRELGLAACLPLLCIVSSTTHAVTGQFSQCTCQSDAQISYLSTELLFISSYTTNNSDMHHIYV